jgi:putative transposase
MKEYQSLAHTRWDCKYHVVFIPKKRKRRIFGVLRKHLGEIFHELAAHKEAKIVEGHVMPDHVHQHSPEICGIECDGIHQGEERNCDSEALWGSSKEFHWRGFLGSRVFCFDGRA